MTTPARKQAATPPGSGLFSRGGHSSARLRQLLRMETTLADYKARCEADGRWFWLAPMLPRLLGAPPSDALWRALFTGASTEWAELRPGENTLVILLFARGAAWLVTPPTFAEVWDDREALYAWDRSAPPDARPPTSADDYARTAETRPDLAAWWAICPFPRLLTWYQTPDDSDPDLSWAAELLALLDNGERWHMAEVLDGRGLVAERFLWPLWDTTPEADRRPAARLAEALLDALDGVDAAERPQTIAEVRQWLQDLQAA